MLFKAEFVRNWTEINYMMQFQYLNVKLIFYERDCFFGRVPNIALYFRVWNCFKIVSQIFSKNKTKTNARGNALRFKMFNEKYVFRFLYYCNSFQINFFGLVKINFFSSVWLVTSF